MNLSIDKVRLSLKHASIVRELESLENTRREQSHSMQDLEVCVRERERERERERGGRERVSKMPKK